MDALTGTSAGFLWGFNFMVLPTQITLHIQTDRPEQTV